MYHQPVLLEESIEGLNIHPNGIYVDATYGGGGHSKKILEKLDNGRLIAFDQDLEAEDNILDDGRLIFIKHNFRYMKNFVKYLGFHQLDGILADLGVSSHHLDAPERGFSFRFEAPLDMRMDKEASLTASYVLNEYAPSRLQEIFRNYGEIRKTRSIVDAIMNYRQNEPIRTTSQLVDLLKSQTPEKTRNKFLARIFQALRIEVNHEVENLKYFLVQSKEMLKKQGRLAVISYHSIEDRLVKNYTKTGNFEGEPVRDFYGNMETPFRVINKKVITPSWEEVRGNNRARSAKLRIAEKSQG
ncbi:MAG TPA: 16S rRNA (cytosine(1402)-N(4))-methyltransferase RsmH [Bacteroidales bacterium]|nr:16S rRNA (cytosine(1402)-N(4))-methyltransferase RsmH [Bacteroidales bacterium]